MYTSIKKIVKKILPQKLVAKNDEIFRRLATLPYRGNLYQCNVCHTRLRKFIKLADADLLCPRCGSRARSRRLFQYLLKNDLLRGHILHFSPPKCLYTKIKKATLEKYYPSDFENEFIADYKFDITQIDLPTHSIDLIICYHILEHIIEDHKAMSEMNRVLKKGGLALIQTPFKEGGVFEDLSIVNSEDRKIAFGQEDHFRIYSREGLKERLLNTGFKVQVLDCADNLKSNKHGFRKESILLASK